MSIYTVDSLTYGPATIGWLDGGKVVGIAAALTTFEGCTFVLGWPAKRRLVVMPLH